ncbi:MAG: hypothetical protein LBF88_05300 [Planctomycetaceae bacterium]|jgi:hypothetical protein|nr:hypothetical protein [Planctomycetaceae bacterium]
MKPNKKNKFDIGLFFTENIEKIILILVIPVAIYIAYLGTQYEPLSWQPDALVKAAENANNTIKTSERKAVDEGVSIITYDVKATWIKAKIRSEYYRTETQWLPSLFPEKNKRSAVNVFTVKDLKAQAGLGAVSINPASPLLADRAAEGGNATTGNTSLSSRIGERWAIVTGLIPIREQLNLYVDKFSSSVLPDVLRDMPTYILYDVERAEIVPGKNSDELEWQRLDFLTEFLQKRSLWSGNAVDPVDPTFFAPQVPGKFPMAYPLPPVTKKFSEEVAHPPFIPMLTDSQMEELKQTEKIREQLRKEMFDIKPEDILDNPFGGSENRIGTTGSGSGGLDGNTVPGRNRRTRRGAQEPEEEEIKPVLVNNYLFRFLDFKVVPGKTYRYRIRLYLANPNYRLAPNYLEDETLSKEPYLITEFSAPSNMVTIPLESRVLTTNVFAVDPKQPWTEPAASIMAVHFDLADGSEWYVEKERVYRGSTINYKRQDVTNPLLEKQTTMSDMESGGSPPSSRSTSSSRTRTTPARPGTARTTELKTAGKQLDIVSEVCVLDMKGGEGLYKIPTAAQKAPDLKSPGRVMVLEPSGNMIIRTVNTDLIEAENIKNPTAVNNLGSGGMGGYRGSDMLN